jgi:hypothetical protein
VPAGGRSLDPALRASFERRMGHDFSRVRVHADADAARSARSIGAAAYTLGSDIVFGAGRFQPATRDGSHLLAHELTHVVQQSRGGAPAAMPYRVGPTGDAHERQADAVADAVVSGGPVGPIAPAGPIVQRRAAPYIKKVTVHLTPPQSADLEWQGTPPSTATGSDHFTVSTGKGYSDPDDPPRTCKRSCCSDPMTQCAPPYNQPDNVGACCTYYGSSFWTGTPLTEHNGWAWWTPIQPYYSSRGIALHAHPEVTGQPIGHGCVRMDEPNAKRIYDYSNGRSTNVTTDGRAAPVLCDDSRRCSGSGTGGAGAGAGVGGEGTGEDTRTAQAETAVPGLEGERS